MILNTAGAGMENFVNGHFGQSCKILRVRAGGEPTNKFCSLTLGVVPQPTV